MRRIKRVIVIYIIFNMVVVLLSSCASIKTYRSSDSSETIKSIKVAVLLYRFDDPYISAVRKSLESIEATNKDKIQFTFYDGMGNQSIQNEILSKVINEGTDLLLINLVDVTEAQSAIDKIKETNIPVILFNREPNVSESPIKSYNRALFIGTDAKAAGILQGKIIISEWNKNKVNIDRNNDDILQYIMLIGERENLEAIGRTKYSILTIQEAGINVEEVATRVCNWDKEIAKDSMQSLLFRYGNRIEAIISNNDAMAIGAIEALQSIGYNKGDKTRTIPVVGVDAIDEAKDFIDKEYMTGTVLQDAYAMAEALYLVGMNLSMGRNPLEGTTYKFDETGVSIRIPYEEYIKNE